MRKSAESKKKWQIPQVYAQFLLSLQQISWMMLIGRDNEKRILQNALADEYSQFIAVYGRRRVGKTNPRELIHRCKTMLFLVD